MIQHGELYLRDMVPPRSKHYEKGKFGRLFPTLPPFAMDNEEVRKALLELGKPGGIMDALDPPPNPSSPDNPAIPAGFTFLGQFLDHDLTFDPTSSLDRQNDPESIENFRTPAFELDSVYGSGKAASPHFYDKTGQRNKLLIDAVAPKDLPRNSQDVAIIGDPRNDENLMVSQLHLAFIKFHNAVVDKLELEKNKNRDVFAEAQRLVRWHYQWMILHEFLPLTVGQEVVDDILDDNPAWRYEKSQAGSKAKMDKGDKDDRRKGRLYYDWRNQPFIPVEFSVAAYRFGHSQIRPGYRANANLAAPIFLPPTVPPNPNPADLSGGRRGPDRFVEWTNFFVTGNNPPNTPLKSKRIDTKLSTPLFNLPFTGPNLPTNPSSLAQRNLLRHLTFSLPSGQSVARAMCIEELKPDDLSDIAKLGVGFEKHTPLWFYILREAEKLGKGERLGPMGGRIVAEVFIGVMEGDRQSYIRQDPFWVPTFGKEGKFGIADLLKFAGVV
ncbi:MAG TPA: heme peroxidase family protein [Chloroflexia bacterium]